eukprot:401542-Pyramimonas_sp.AAC.1
MRTANNPRSGVPALLNLTTARAREMNFAVADLQSAGAPCPVSLSRKRSKACRRAPVGRFG